MLYFLEDGVQYPKELHELHSNLPERMKIGKTEELLVIFKNMLST